MYAIMKNRRGISRIILLILLVVSGIVGAVLSYMWTVGYYVDKEFRVPQDVTTITITNVTFPLRNSTYFDVTILNPSFSKTGANITGIAMIVTEDNLATIIDIPAASIEPSIPYNLGKSKVVTFRCSKNWGEFAGQTIRVAVFIQEESGATSPYKTTRVKLEIIKTEFDTTVTIEGFNLTIRNSAESSIALNITEILFDSDSIPFQNITVQNENATLPQHLQPGQNRTFICAWNLWRKGALGIVESSHTITSKTSQGYSATKTISLPPVVSFNITSVALNTSDTSGFNVTVSSLSPSPHYVNISRVTITNGTQVFENVTIIGEMPRALMPGENVTLQFLWKWEAFRDRNLKIMIYTTQGFSTYIYKTFE